MRRFLLAALLALAPAVALAAGFQDAPPTPTFVPLGYASGCAFSNDAGSATDTVDVAAPCQASDVTGAYVMTLPSSFTKKLQTTGAWTAGTGGNCLFAGARAISTWYHIFLVHVVATNAVDIGCDTDVNAAHIPAGLDAYRRITNGSVLTDASGSNGAIVAFRQVGATVYWAAPVENANAAAVTTTASLMTLTVPTGLKVRPIVTVSTLATAAALLTSPDQPDLMPTVGASFATSPGSNVGNANSVTPTFSQLFTNTSAQLRVRATATGTITAYTWGWIEE